MLHRGLKSIRVWFNDDPRLTLVYLTAMSNLVTGFSVGKDENSGFSETIAASYQLVSGSSHLIEYMKVCEC